MAAIAMPGELHANADVITTLHTTFRILIFLNSTGSLSLELLFAGTESEVDWFLQMSCCLVLGGVVGVEKTRERCAGGRQEQQSDAMAESHPNQLLLLVTINAVQFADSAALGAEEEGSEGAAHQEFTLHLAKCANHSKGYSAHNSLQSAAEDFSSPKVATGPRNESLIT